VNNDTDLGGAATSFPPTQGSLVLAAGSTVPDVRKQAQETLINAYWKPVYKYIRVRWGAPIEDAKDLTQGFFAVAMEKGFFDRFDPTKARFRTFVRLCVDGFVAKERRAATRLKRGGLTSPLSLDFATADGELLRQVSAPDADPDAYFHKEWLRGLFALAVEDLRSECAATGKQTHFALFERYDLDGPDAQARLTYEQLGRDFGLSQTQVTNYLALARRRFRQILLDKLRASTGSDDEFQEEVRRLFGGDRS
jgi:RNA polymerase sigma factor (sigma-70 family)